MGVTAIQAAEILFGHLSKSGLRQAITGNIYLFQRRSEHQGEDIVINTIGVNNQSVQRGILNVNVYVPNHNLNGEQHRMEMAMPNLARLSELAALGKAALDLTWNAGELWNFEYQQDTVMPDRNNEHFINFRVEFRAINIKF